MKKNNNNKNMNNNNNNRNKTNKNKTIKKMKLMMIPVMVRIIISINIIIIIKDPNCYPKRSSSPHKYYNYIHIQSTILFFFPNFRCVFVSFLSIDRFSL